MKKSFLKYSFFLIFLLLNGCILTGNRSPQSKPQVINDYPTQTRVEFVLQCIEKEGGLRYETLYPCVCSIDKIATQMSHDEYDQALTFTFMRRTPGENGGVFRDPANAKKLRKKLKDAKKFANNRCFVRP
ncbi:MAG: hypothetical protein QF470_01075 [Methylococcales bacterium]|jgi:hypothetical protein|nr:hypothetical protein [Methylococcales bacterium]